MDIGVVALDPGGEVFGRCASLRLRVYRINSTPAVSDLPVLRHLHRRLCDGDGTFLRLETLAKNTKCLIALRGDPYLTTIKLEPAAALFLGRAFSVPPALSDLSQDHHAR